MPREPCGTGWPDTGHGTRSWYVNRKCRCARCRKANTVYTTRLRRKRSAREKEERGVHGKVAAPAPR
jgi:hypothetical protein